METSSYVRSTSYELFECSSEGCPGLLRGIGHLMQLQRSLNASLAVSAVWGALGHRIALLTDSTSPISLKLPVCLHVHFSKP